MVGALEKKSGRRGFVLEAFLPSDYVMLEIRDSGVFETKKACAVFIL